MIADIVQTNHKKEKTEMYEKPKLNRVGDAQDVILGFIAFGDDLDMNSVASTTRK